jgi:hypothetical protein
MGGPFPRQEYATRIENNKVPGQLAYGPKDATGATLPTSVVQKASDAARHGIREVFDTAVLSSLVDTADLSELRKDYISRMIRGMDAVGRMLFLFYWHRDEFKKRYGDADMRELENTLREVFRSTGDLVLFLREKTSYNPEISESLLGTLSEDVGSAASADSVRQ